MSASPTLHRIASLAIVMAMVLSIAAWLGPSPARSDATAALPPRTAGAIEARIERVAEQPDAARAAKATLGQARVAIEQSRLLETQGERAAAERARLIAWAAVILAEHQVARYRELRAAQNAERRALLAEQRARRAREALQAAMAEHARTRVAPEPDQTADPTATRESEKASDGRRDTAQAGEQESP